jgi:hypothetical protein
MTDNFTEIQLVDVNTAFTKATIRRNKDGTATFVLKDTHFTGNSTTINHIQMTVSRAQVRKMTDVLSEKSSP